MSFLDGDPIVPCKFCGEEGLHWSNESGEFRLYDEEDELHVCGVDRKIAAAEEFPMPEPTEEEWSEGESTA